MADEYKTSFSASLSYPKAALRRGTTGTTSLEVAISADGIVESVQLRSSSGSAILDRAAIDAARLAGVRLAPGRRLVFTIRAVFAAQTASSGG
ncbi:MAG: energy transducer TonB [Spirochaetales bacterium]|nr:energy transducer TonB [Spirochaetales bacterium]